MDIEKYCRNKNYCIKDFIEHETWKEELYGSRIQKRIKNIVTNYLGYSRIPHGEGLGEKRWLESHLNFMNKTVEKNQKEMLDPPGRG